MPAYVYVDAEGSRPVPANIPVSPHQIVRGQCPAPAPFEPVDRALKRKAIQNILLVERPIHEQRNGSDKAESCFFQGAHGQLFASRLGAPSVHLFSDAL